jgi:hypothetical protein
MWIFGWLANGGGTLSISGEVPGDSTSIATYTANYAGTASTAASSASVAVVVAKATPWRFSS